MTEYSERERKLRSCAEEILNINGLETLLFAPKDFPEILEMMGVAAYCGSIISALRYPNLRPGLVYCPRHAERYRFLPTLCRRYGDRFYFVEVHSRWRCKACGQEHGDVLVQSNEMDSISASHTGKSYPELAPIFRTQRCKNCGNLLQGKLMFLEEETVFTDIRELFRYMEEAYGEEFPWFLLTNGGTSLMVQAGREIREGHPLYGTELCAVAKNGRNDDVLFVGDECYWIVHLTWSNNTDMSYPRYDMFRDLNELKDFLENSVEE